MRPPTCHTSPSKTRRSPKKAKFTFNLKKMLGLGRGERAHMFHGSVSPIHTRPRMERSFSEPTMRIERLSGDGSSDRGGDGDLDDCDALRCVKSQDGLTHDGDATDKTISNASTSEALAPLFLGDLRDSDSASMLIGDSASAPTSHEQVSLQLGALDADNEDSSYCMKERPLATNAQCGEEDKGCAEKGTHHELFSSPLSRIEEVEENEAEMEGDAGLSTTREELWRVENRLQLTFSQNTHRVRVGSLPGSPIRVSPRLMIIFEEDETKSDDGSVQLDTASDASFEDERVILEISKRDVASTDEGDSEEFVISQDGRPTTPGVTQDDTVDTNDHTQQNASVKSERAEDDTPRSLSPEFGFGEDDTLRALPLETDFEFADESVQVELNAFWPPVRGSDILDLFDADAESTWTTSSGNENTPRTDSSSEDSRESTVESSVSESNVVDLLVGVEDSLDTILLIHGGALRIVNDALGLPHIDEEGETHGARTPLTLAHPGLEGDEDDAIDQSASGWEYQEVMRDVEDQFDLVQEATHSDDFVGAGYEWPEVEADFAPSIAAESRLDGRSLQIGAFIEPEVISGECGEDLTLQPRDEEGYEEACTASSRVSPFAEIYASPESDANADERPAPTLREDCQNSSTEDTMTKYLDFPCDEELQSGTSRECPRRQVYLATSRSTKRKSRDHVSAGSATLLVFSMASSAALLLCGSPRVFTMSLQRSAGMSIGHQQSKCEEIWSAVAPAEHTVRDFIVSVFVATELHVPPEPRIEWHEEDVRAACEFVLATYADEDIVKAETEMAKTVDAAVSDGATRAAHDAPHQSPSTDLRAQRYILGLAVTLLIVAFLQYDFRG